jgi:hypothetical protein
MRKLLFLLPLIFAACSGNEPQTETGNDTASAAVKSDSVSDWQELAESWTASLNLRNASIMKSFYADSVNYYGDAISSDDVVSRQTAYFDANKDYHQKIVEYMDEEQQSDGSWRIRIRKQVTAGGKTADYPASLVFANSNGIWKIVSESDDITDINKARELEVHYAPESVTVEGLVEETSGFLPSKEGDPKSNGKENYFIIWPSSRLDVIAKDNSTPNVTEKGIDRLQVLGDEAKIRSLLNKKVRITGTLSHQSAPHHFTKVLIEVKSIEEVK